MKTNRLKRVLKSVGKQLSRPASKPDPVMPESACPPCASAPETTPLRGQTRFELSAPEAREVYLAGSFNNWRPTATPLRRAGPELWAAELTLPAGQHEYLFVVDGQWVVDGKAEAFTPNPYGGVNALLTISTAA